jgi:hypothetical protein
MSSFQKDRMTMIGRTLAHYRIASALGPTDPPPLARNGPELRRGLTEATP